MTSTEPTPTNREREQARFAALCRRHGCRAEHFRVTEGLSDDDSELGGAVEVVHTATGCRRQYRRDHFGGWLDAFENDLIRGEFDGHHQRW